MSDQADDGSVAAIPVPPVDSSSDPMEAALAVVRGDAARKDPDPTDGPIADSPDGSTDGPTDGSSDGSTEDAAHGVAIGEAAGDGAGESEAQAGSTAGSTAEPTLSVKPVAHGTTMGDFRMAVVSAVAMDLPNQYPSVVLRETESPRRQLTFSVGFQDGVALSTALRRVPTPRPLTHEMMADILAGFDIDVVAVRLVGRQGTTYFAELDLRGRNGRSVHSCRPTDALTLALRQLVPVPILIDSRLFEVLGDVEPPGGP